jgi:hypothetical protein
VSQTVAQPPVTVRRIETRYGLSELQTMALIYCYSEGYSAEDAADMLGSTPSAVYKALARARAKLVSQGIAAPRRRGCLVHRDTLALHARMRGES